VCSTQHTNHCSALSRFLLQALFADRSEGSGSGVGSKLASQLLLCMDELGRWRAAAAGRNVVVLAATNSPEAIDTAFLRPGRYTLSATGANVLDTQFHYLLEPLWCVYSVSVHSACSNCSNLALTLITILASTRAAKLNCWLLQRIYAIVTALSIQNLYKRASFTAQV
jgi:ATPase family associated with various cellular activities (AAA)